MNNRTATTPDSRTPTEAAGYIAGAFTGIAQALMPVRMWVLLAASIWGLIEVFQTASLVGIARVGFLYMVVVAVLLGSVIFQRK